MPQYSQQIELLYVTDPMCAWCYGFTPVVRRLQAFWQPRLSVKIVVAGLHPYATEPLAPDERERLAISWHQVQERTQLPFDFSFFLNRDFVYDTEPPCRALLAAGLLRPNLQLEVLRALHAAFYADRADITKTETLVRIMNMFGIPENLFLALFESEEISRQTEEQFDQAKQIGATKLPSLFRVTNTGPVLLTQGYAGFDELEEQLFRQLKQPGF